jgi:cellulose synthase/poly-beta-1,6-N-acetylglucosamine synthase-like glycosyltransferase
MWEFLFWCSAAVIVYPYIGYPALLYLFARLKRLETVENHDAAWPTLCLLISAFNEEKVIRKKIENSLSLKYPKDRLRIMVASDGSTDNTVRIAGDYEDLGVEVFHIPQRRGKSAIINDAMKTINEGVVVFTDANCMFAEDALEKLARHFSDSQIGCVVGKLRYVERHLSSVGKGEGAYWKYEAKISMLESELRSVLVANGPIFAIRRSLFRELYPEVANDFQLPVEIASQGYGVVHDPDAVAFERSTIFWREEFQRKVRIVLRGLAGFSILRGKFRGFRLWQFVSHKLLRWVMGPFLLLAFLSNAVLFPFSLVYASFFACQVLFYVAAINGWRLKRTRKPRSIYYVPFYFTMVNFAAIVAIAKFSVGRRQAVWEKAESARFSPAPGSENGFSADKQLPAEHEDGTTKGIDSAAR